MNIKKKETFHIHIHKSQYKYQDEIPASREKV